MTAYVVMLKERTRDAAEMAIYSEKAAAARGDHALTPLAIYGQIDHLEGAPAEGAVIVSFPTMAEARAWYDSPAYQDARSNRMKGADYRMFIVEGV